MKRAVFLLVMLTSFVFAGVPLKKFATKEEATQAHREAVERVGGIVTRPAQGPSVCFVDMQNVLNEKDTKLLFEQLVKVVRVESIFKRESNVAPLVLAKRYFEDEEIAAAVFVCEVGSGEPALVVWPELNAAVVNVVALQNGNPQKSVLLERVRKELFRAFGFVFGAGYSYRNTNNCMVPVSGVRALDRLKGDGFGLDGTQAIMQTMQRFGMVPPKKTSYKKACEEGWAPPPTNEVQRALWQAVKKGAEK